MSSVTNFLTSGTTPATGQQESESSTSLPSWYTDYTSQILNKAAQYANEPYQPYKGPTVAGLDPNSTAAAGQSGALAGMANAGATAGKNLVTQGANMSAAGAAQPDINAGVQGLQDSVAPGQGGLSAAQPYLNSASTPAYSNVDSYMNPYNQQVTDAIAEAGNRNFNQNTLPSIQSSIIGAGNITGSSTQGANLIENAAQQNNQNITNAQAGALQSGYAQSLGASQTDAARAAQLAATSGQLGTAQQTAEQNAATGQINAGVATGNLTSADQAGKINAGGALSNITTANNANDIAAEQNQNSFGTQAQGQVQKNYDQAKADFTAQKQDPLVKAGAMQGALSGINVPTTTTNYGAYTGTPANISNSPLVTATNALNGLSASTTPG